MTPVIAGSINRTPTGPQRRCDMFILEECPFWTQPAWRDGNPQGIALRRARVYPLLLGSGPGMNADYFRILPIPAHRDGAGSVIRNSEARS